MTTITHNGKIVGKTIGEVYITERDRNKHFFRKYQGWGISEEIIDNLISLEVKKILIREEVDHLFMIEDFLNGEVFHDGKDKQYIAKENGN